MADTRIRTRGRLALERVTPAMLVERAAETCLIHSGQNGMWWKAGRAGYTDDVAQAGRYAFADAHAATRDCGREKRIAFEFPVDEDGRAGG